MTQQKNRSSYRQNIDPLARKLHHVMRDFQKGKVYRGGEDKRIPGTGYPWVQIARHRIGQIDGWLALDRYDSVNTVFPALEIREAISVIAQRRGVFATVDSLRRETFPPLFLTHPIENALSTDRLMADMKFMFDLTIVMTWSSDDGYGDRVIHREIVPRCRVQDFVMSAIEKRQRLIVHKLGTENQMRRIAQQGAKTSEHATDMLGQFLGNERLGIEERITESVREFLAQTFDAGLKWGENVTDSTENVRHDMFQNIVTTA